MWASPNQQQAQSGGGGQMVMMSPQQQQQQQQPNDPQQQMQMQMQMQMMQQMMNDMRASQQQLPSMQQQQQQQQQNNPAFNNNNNNAAAYPQQQQHPSSPQGYQQQPGCCDGPQPQNPGEPQPGPFACCCPANPEEHIFSTSPADPTALPQDQSCLSCLWSCCDFTTWLVAVLIPITILGFSLTLALNAPDDLMGLLGAEDSAQLDFAVFEHLKDYQPSSSPVSSSTATPPAVTTSTSSNSSTTAAPPATPSPQALGSRMCAAACSYGDTKEMSKCRSKSGSSALVGSYGSLCMEDTVTGVAMMMNISRWVNFRATLYFIAMMGCIVLLGVIIIVNKQIHPAPQFVMGTTPPPAPPYQFYATPLYYCFRLVWGTLSIVFFFWICTEMYQYWWFIDYYCDRTSGKLLEFWQDFDTKFMWTMIIIFVFLCWPLCHLVLEFVWFILFGPIWFCVRQCYPSLANHQRNKDIPQDEQSCCIRSDMFFCEMNQLWRAGFSEGQWKLLTNTTTPFFTCCDQQQQQQQGYPTAPQTMDQQQTQQQPQQGTGGFPTSPRQHSPPSFNQQQQQQPQNPQMLSATSFSGGRGFPGGGGNSTATSQNFGTPTGSHGAFGAGAGAVRVSSSWGGATATEQGDLAPSQSTEKKKKKKKKKDADGNEEVGGASSEKKKKKKKKDPDA